MRFLKVVKTLYETSTFTQLGKTVGSALNTTGGAPPTEATDEQPELEVGSEKFTQARESIIASQESILDAIAEACKPIPKATKCLDKHILRDPTCGTAAALASKRADGQRQSLLEQMMNCTLLGPPDDEYFSDEDDTYKTGTYDEDTDGIPSFESLTEDEDEFRRGRGRRRTRR